MTRRTKAKPNESKTTNPKLTAYERTRARQAGASIDQLGPTAGCGTHDEAQRSG